MSKKSPQLRFEGFTDAWEERKLSSGLREYTDRVIVEDDKEYYQISVRNNFGGITLRGSKMGNKIGRKRQAKINLTKYPQTLIFTRQTVEQGGIGWVDKYCDGAIVTENMPTISLDTSVFSKYFLTNLFQTRIFYKNAILDNIEGGSAQIAIHESKFLSSTLLFPNLDEQEKIGQFFKQLDDTIDLHQRKLDLLKEQKKGYLQKMFPKNGAKVPELRFAGFADDWEERKLKDIAQFNPKTVLPDEFEYVDLESVVGTEMISHRTESKDQAPSRAQRLAQKGDVFYQTVRPYQMNNYLYDLPYDNYVFSTGYAQMRPNIDSYFLLNSVQNKQFVQHVLDRSTGTSYPAINSSDLSNIEIHVPSKLSEQQKIGAFFQSIDDTIALHQRKLDLLKEQKKGFLQKMFV